LFKNCAIVELFVFSRTLDVKRYDLEWESALNLPTITFATYFSRGSVVSSIEKKKKRAVYVSRIFCKKS
jgi:hypothetical protein